MNIVRYIDESSYAPAVWTPEEMEAIRRSSDVWFARRDVSAAQSRFRRCYLGTGRTINLCRCMAHVEPHLHAPHKLTRIGHLPMFTMKELPE